MRWVQGEKSNLRLGTDLVFMPRFKDKVNDQKFIDKVLTDREKSLYNTITHDRLRLEFLAGRFACKEAYSKALGKGIGLIDFLDIEILRDEYGAPISNLGQFSISHDGDYLFVVVLL